MSETKHVIQSKTNSLGLAAIGIAGFAIYQDYAVGGVGAIEQTDVGVVIAGVCVIINRLTDKAAKRLHWVKK